MNFYYENNKYTKLIPVKRMSLDNARDGIAFIWNQHFKKNNKKSRMKLANFIKKLGTNLLKLEIKRKIKIEKF